MYIWGIFHSCEGQDETIHMDDFEGSLFLTEELAIQYLKSKEKWWRNMYSDPCLTEWCKKELFDSKTPDEAIHWTKEPNEYDDDEVQIVLSHDYSGDNGIKMRKRYVARQLNVREQ